MGRDDTLMDANAIAALLGYTSRRAASNLLHSGRLKTARKFGNAWVAERWEVLEYQQSAKEYIYNRQEEKRRRANK